MKLAKRYPILFFFVTALLFTYVAGVLVYLALSKTQKALGTAIPGVNDVLLVFGPTFAGILTVRLVSGKASVTALFRSCVQWQAAWVVYAFVLLVPPLLTICALFIRGYGTAVLSLSIAGVVSTYALTLLHATLLGGGLGEELGWRGFLFPWLCHRFTPLVSALLVAVLWFLWHVPAYILFNKGADDPILPFAAILVPWSVIFSWAYLRSKKSLLFVIVLHGAVNASFYTIQSLMPKVAEAKAFEPLFDWTLAALYYLVAIIIIAIYGVNLGKQETT